MSENQEAAVRFVDRKEGVIEGLVIPFFGPVGGDKDLYGTRFSENTDYAMDWWPEGGRPGLYSHGFDDDIQLEVIGRELPGTRMTDKGVWMRAQLDKAHRFADEIMELVDAGALAFSSGTIDHLMKVNGATRDVERWPWVEWSLVPNPGNPEARIYSVRSTDAIAHAPEVAVRIVESLEDLLPNEPEPEPPAEEQAPPADPTESVRAFVRSMRPDALHDLAVEMGAACIANQDVIQPEPTVTITSSAESVRLVDDGLRAELLALARATAHELTK